MITLRAYPEQFGEEDYTEAVFNGEDEEQLAQILSAALYRLGWEVWLAEGEEDFVVIGRENEE